MKEKIREIMWNFVAGEVTDSEAVQQVLDLFADSDSGCECSEPIPQMTDRGLYCLRCQIPIKLKQSEQLFCRDCKYDKAETYHDKMWCRDCRQKDRFTAK